MLSSSVELPPRPSTSATRVGGGIGSAQQQLNSSAPSVSSASTINTVVTPKQVADKVSAYTEKILAKQRRMMEEQQQGVGGTNSTRVLATPTGGNGIYSYFGTPVASPSSPSAAPRQYSSPFSGGIGGGGLTSLSRPATAGQAQQRQLRSALRSTSVTSSTFGGVGGGIPTRPTSAAMVGPANSAPTTPQQQDLHDDNAGAGIENDNSNNNITNANGSSRPASAAAAVNGGGAAPAPTLHAARTFLGTAPSPLKKSSYLDEVSLASLLRVPLTNNSSNTIHHHHNNNTTSVNNHSTAALQQPQQKGGMYSLGNISAVVAGGGASSVTSSLPEKIRTSTLLTRHLSAADQNLIRNLVDESNHHNSNLQQNHQHNGGGGGGVLSFGQPHNVSGETEAAAAAAAYHHAAVKGLRSDAINTLQTEDKTMNVIVADNVSTLKDQSRAKEIFIALQQDTPSRAEVREAHVEAERREMKRLRKEERLAKMGQIDHNHGAGVSAATIAAANGERPPITFSSKYLPKDQQQHQSNQSTNHSATAIGDALYDIDDERPTAEELTDPSRHAYLGRDNTTIDHDGIVRYDTLDPRHKVIGTADDEKLNSMERCRAQLGASPSKSRNNATSSSSLQMFDDYSLHRTSIHPANPQWSSTRLPPHSKKAAVELYREQQFEQWASVALQSIDEALRSEAAAVANGSRRGGVEEVGDNGTVGGGGSSFTNITRSIRRQIDDEVSNRLGVHTTQGLNQLSSTEGPHGSPDDASNANAGFDDSAIAPQDNFNPARLAPSDPTVRMQMFRHEVLRRIGINDDVARVALSTLPAVAAAAEEEAAAGDAANRGGVGGDNNNSDDSGHHPAAISASSAIDVSTFRNATLSPSFSTTLSATQRFTLALMGQYESYISYLTNAHSLSAAQVAVETLHATVKELNATNRAFSEEKHQHDAQQNENFELKNENAMLKEQVSVMRDYIDELRVAVAAYSNTVSSNESVQLAAGSSSSPAPVSQQQQQNATTTATLHNTTTSSSVAPHHVSLLSQSSTGSGGDATNTTPSPAMLFPNEPTAAPYVEAVKRFSAEIAALRVHNTKLATEGSALARVLQARTRELTQAQETLTSMQLQNGQLRSTMKAIQQYAMRLEQSVKNMVGVRDAAVAAEMRSVELECGSMVALATGGADGFFTTYSNTSTSGSSSANGSQPLSIFNFPTPQFSAAVSDASPLLILLQRANTPLTPAQQTNPNAVVPVPRYGAAAVSTAAAVLTVAASAGMNTASGAVATAGLLSSAIAAPSSSSQLTIPHPSAASIMSLIACGGELAGASPSSSATGTALTVSQQQNLTVQHIRDILRELFAEITNNSVNSKKCQTTAGILTVMRNDAVEAFLRAKEEAANATANSFAISSVLPAGSRVGSASGKRPGQRRLGGLSRSRTLSPSGGRRFGAPSAGYGPTGSGGLGGLTKTQRLVLAFTEKKSRLSGDAAALQTGVWLRCAEEHRFQSSEAFLFQLLCAHRIPIAAYSTIMGRMGDLKRVIASFINISNGSGGVIAAALAGGGGTSPPTSPSASPVGGRRSSSIGGRASISGSRRPSSAGSARSNTNSPTRPKSGGPAGAGGAKKKGGRPDRVSRKDFLMAVSAALPYTLTPDDIDALAGFTVLMQQQSLVGALPGPETSLLKSCLACDDVCYDIFFERLANPPPAPSCASWGPQMNVFDVLVRLVLKSGQTYTSALGAAIIAAAQEGCGSALQNHAERMRAQGLVVAAGRATAGGISSAGGNNANNASSAMRAGNSYDAHNHDASPFLGDQLLDTDGTDMRIAPFTSMRLDAIVNAVWSAVKRVPMPSSSAAVGGGATNSPVTASASALVRGGALPPLNASSKPPLPSPSSMLSSSFEAPFTPSPPSAHSNDNPESAQRKLLASTVAWLVGGIPICSPIATDGAFNDAGGDSDDDDNGGAFSRNGGRSRAHALNAAASAGSGGSGAVTSGTASGGGGASSAGGLTLLTSVQLSVDDRDLFMAPILSPDPNVASFVSAEDIEDSIANVMLGAVGEMNIGRRCPMVSVRRVLENLNQHVFVLPPLPEALQ